MYARANKETSSNESEDKQAQKVGSEGSVFQFQDNRPDAIAQRKLQETASKGLKAREITQLKTLADMHAIGTKVQINPKGKIESWQETESTSESPVQLQLNQGAVYRVNQVEQGRHRTPTGKVSNAQANGFPSTQIGQVYQVMGFANKNNIQYMELRPFAPGANALFIPVGNDGFYDLEPELDNSNSWNDASLSLLEVKGNAYNNQAPVATDISQGEVGNCWLIAPMMAMTLSNHWNQHIANLIQQQGQDYQVQLGNPANINTGQGVQTQMVTISGWIPTVDVTNGNGPIEFLYAQLNKGMPGKLAGGQSGPVWPSLLEKATATSFGGGSYQGLDNNDANIGFQLLGHTQPQTLMPVGSTTQPYANMILAMGNDASGTATTKTDAASSQTLSTDANDLQLMNAAFLGLIEDHVYIILPASSVQNLVLSNPHAGNHPTGPIPQANVDEVISRIDYLPVPQQPAQQPQAPQQQAQAPQQQVPPVQVPQQQVQVPPPQLANAVQQAQQQVQVFNQQQQAQALQQVQLQPVQVQAQLIQQLQLVHQQVMQFQQQQFQHAYQASSTPSKKQKTSHQGGPP